VANNKGVICINFYSGFISAPYFKQSEILSAYKKQFKDSLALIDGAADLDKKWDEYQSKILEPLRPTLAQLVDHIDYIVKLVGDDYVGIGSDYDGVGSLPVGMEDVTTYPKITEELKRRGYSDKSVKKILGGNVLRVMKANFR
jgi:membrane dipeptidase